MAAVPRGGRFYVNHLSEPVDNFEKSPYNFILRYKCLGYYALFA